MRPIFAAFFAGSLMLAGAAAPARAQSPVLRFQIIEADGFTETDPAIADVRDALSDLFRFRGYRLAAETVIRADGGGFSQQVAADGGRVFLVDANHVEHVKGNQDSGDSGMVALHELSLWLGSGQRIIETSLNVPVGQTVVVGSARPSDDGPVLILVVRTSR